MAPLLRLPRRREAVKGGQVTDLIFRALLVLSVGALLLGIWLDYRQTYGGKRRGIF